MLQPLICYYIYKVLLRLFITNISPKNTVYNLFIIHTKASVQKYLHKKTYRNFINVSHLLLQFFNIQNKEYLIQYNLKNMEDSIKVILLIILLY